MILNGGMGKSYANFHFACLRVFYDFRKEKALSKQRGYDVCGASPTGIIEWNSFNPPVVATLQPGATKREALRASIICIIYSDCPFLSSMGEGWPR